MSIEKSIGRPAKAPRVNLKDLKKLIDMMRKAELSEVHIEQEGLKINLKKDEKSPLVPGPAAPAAAQPAASAAAAAPAPAPAAAPAAPAAPAPAAAPVEDGEVVHSPMVGTLYRSPSPDKGPFVKEGSRVEVGQTVCIIEAMKLMNEIKAESAGTLVRFLCENTQPVEFGQPLYLLKP
ncbi:MAG TPA: acetyl-CoA carboxylase biotin carboxyl carrier protein [bacterium]|jgi:acetyl-CoA carboxylase biotin carboxyl carrier protein|nr:acetyl-CoA carboxylase biotin carboxyl carrier protein [bacterium]